MWSSFHRQKNSISTIPPLSSQEENIYIALPHLAMGARLQKNDFEPDYLEYYKHMILKLFSGGDELLIPFSGSNSKREGTNYSSSGDGSSSATTNFSFFTNGLVTGHSDFERERLMGLLDQSIGSLKYKIDEMLDQILAKSEIESKLKENSIKATDDMSKCNCPASQMLPSCPLRSFFCVDSSPKSQSSIQIYNNFHHHFQDGLRPNEALNKCSTDILMKLEKTRHNLEEYLDAVMSECRAMTSAEKVQLGQRIHKLPSKALDRVVEILQHRNRHAKTSNEISINLEEEDDGTLWRLHTFVKVVRKANR